jgi:hypothetical protein
MTGKSPPAATLWPGWKRGINPQTTSYASSPASISGSLFRVWSVAPRNGLALTIARISQFRYSSSDARRRRCSRRSSAAIYTAWLRGMPGRVSKTFLRQRNRRPAVPFPVASAAVTAIKKPSYIRFATSFPGAGRPTTSDARHSLQFAVIIWQRFQMPTPTMASVRHHDRLDAADRQRGDADLPKIHFIAVREPRCRDMRVPRCL